MDLVQKTNGIPEGVTETVLRVLVGHIGKANAIGCWQLAHEVTVRCGFLIPTGGEGYLQGIHPYEGVIRAAIQELRSDKASGALICSSSTGRDYFLAADGEELEHSITQQHLEALRHQMSLWR